MDTELVLGELLLVLSERRLEFGFVEEIRLERHLLARGAEALHLRQAQVLLEQADVLRLLAQQLILVIEMLAVGFDQKVFFEEQCAQFSAGESSIITGNFLIFRGRLHG